MEVFERQRGDVFQRGRCGLSPEFEPFELGEFREVDGADIGELRVREANALQVRQMIAQFLQTFVVDTAAAMADFDELLETLKLRIGSAGNCGAYEREGLQVLQSGELLHSRVGKLTVVREAQGLEARELRDVRHPRVVELRGDDVERLKRGDVAEVLEERRVIRIVFAMVVRSRARHREVDEPEALPVLSLFDFAFGGFDRTNDRFDMCVESEDGAGSEMQGENGKDGWSHDWSHDWSHGLSHGWDGWMNERGVFVVTYFLACDDGHDVVVPCEAACFLQLSAVTDLVGLQGGSFISGDHQEASSG